jgi:hypothetical protein
LARLIDNIPERPPNRDIRQLARVLRFFAFHQAQFKISPIECRTTIPLKERT